MNRIKIYLLLIGVVSLIFGCNEIDQTYGGPWFVYTEAESGEVFESDPEILSVPVVVSSNDYSTQTAVTFKVESENATEGVDFEILNEGRDLIFEPGVAVQNIDIKFMDNDDADGDLEVIISLVSSNKGDYEIGKPGPDNAFSSYTLTILDDDCPFIPEDYSKALSGYETCKWWSDIECSKFEFLFIEEVSPNVYKYDVIGFWSGQIEGNHNDKWFAPGDVVTYLPVPVLIDLNDPVNPTIEILGGVGAVYNGDNYEVKATKADLYLSTCNKEMRFIYQMTDFASWVVDVEFELNFDFK
ncbi:hypothetical protein DMA11_16470 [Marinilabiliaceae bacterium JC017]|nr:hypothetical protein DMA11_16470 [Marinilabiliaceae bacterium JC017]